MIPVLCFSPWGVLDSRVGASYLDHTAHVVQDHSGGLPGGLPWHQGRTGLSGAQSGFSNSSSQRYPWWNGVCNCLLVCLPVHVSVCHPTCLCACWPACLSVFLPVHVSVHLPVHVSVFSPACPCDCPPACLSVFPPVHIFPCDHLPVHVLDRPPASLSVFLPVHPCDHLPVHVSVHLPAHWSSCLSIYVTTCLSMCLSMWPSTYLPVGLQSCPSMWPHACPCDCPPACLLGLHACPSMWPPACPCVCPPACLLGLHACLSMPVHVTACLSMWLSAHLSVHGDGDSSVVRAPDSWLKGPGFKSLQERRENFLLQGRLSVLTLMSVSVPPPCYCSST